MNINKSQLGIIGGGILGGAGLLIASFTGSERIFQIVMGFVGGGGLVAFIAWLANRNKTNAEAQNINITGELNLGKGWKEYADKMEVRADEAMKKLDDVIKAHKQELDAINRRMAEKDARHQQEIDAKDTIIRQLRGMIFDLEQELKRYTNVDIRAESARKNLHKGVDNEIEKIKEDSYGDISQNKKDHENKK